MIILRVGHREFLLPDLNSAQTMLDIFSKSQELDSRYNHETHDEIYKLSSTSEIKISIVKNNIKTEDEFNQIFGVEK